MKKIRIIEEKNMARYSLIPRGIKKDLEPFIWLRQEVDSLFDNFWKSSGIFTHISPYEKQFPLLPNIDVSETENEFVVTAELPGLKEKDINVEVRNNLLRISGEKKLDREEKGKNFYHMERMSGSFDRSFQLPSRINEDNIQANCKNGVLTIILPKSEEGKNNTKRIEVKKE